MTASVGLAAALAFAVTMSTCIAIVLTQNLHGRLTLDSTFGVQKFHKAPTPRVGGIAVLTGLGAACAVGPPWADELLGPMLIASAPAFAAGLTEDVTKKGGVLERLVSTMISGVLAWGLTGAMVQRTGVHALDALLGYAPFAILFTAFCVSGMANAVNIIDGFNGLAGGVVVIMLAALGAIAAQVGDPELAMLCMLVAAGVLGFLAVNWPSGRIFLGDGGAYLLGFLVGWVAVTLVARHPQVSPWAPLLACAYPVLEVAFSSCRKSRRAGSSPGQPDRVHLHMLVHRRVVRTRLGIRSGPLQNAFTSPFAWLYAAATASWAVLWWQNTAALLAGFGAAAFAYWSVYTRLAKFRWLPPARRSRAPASRPVGTVFSAAGQGLRMAAPTVAPLAASAAPPVQARAMHRAPAGWTPSRLMYLLLGASSCVVLIEPAPFELIALLLMLAHAAQHVHEQRWQRIAPLTANMLLLLVLFAILQFVPVALQAHSPVQSAFYAGVTTMLILIGLHLGQLHDRRDVRFFDFLAGYAAAALLTAVLALVSLHPLGAAIGGDFLLWDRPRVFFKDPNVLGPYLVPASVLFLEGAARRRGGRALLFVLFAIVCAAGTLASASRAAWINLGIALAIYGLLGSGRQKAVLAFAALIVAAAAIPLGAVLDGGGSDALQLYSGRMQLQEYDSDRFTVAAEAFELGLRYPAGVGPGEIATYLGAGAGMDPHNTYVRIWAENGPVAMGLFAVILLLMLAHALQERLAAGRWDAALVCALALLAGALVNASVVDTLHWRHFWVIFAVCLFSFNRRVRAPRPYRAMVRV